MNYNMKKHYVQFQDNHSKYHELGTIYNFLINLKTLKGIINRCKMIKKYNNDFGDNIKIDGSEYSLI